MKNIFITILRVLTILAVLASGTIGYVVFEDTLAPWWIPAGVSFVAAALTLPLYKKWNWLTVTDGKVVNLLCHFVCVGSMAYGLFLAGNFKMADVDSTKEVTVTVLRKYVEQHEKKRKVGKYRYVSDGIRKEYYLEVAFENGSVETLHVSLSTYNKARKGKPKNLVLQKGFFGLPVITKGL